MVWSTHLLSLRASLTRYTEPALIAVSTMRPAANSRICQNARRRCPSAVTTISLDRSWNSKCPLGTAPPSKTRWGPTGSLWQRLFRRWFRLAGEILFQPMDVVVAVDDVVLADQIAEQRQRGLDAF